MTKLIVISAIFFMAIFFVACKDSGQAADAVKKEGQKNDQTPSGKAVKTILFFGNSLTAGYGLEPAEAYPSLIQAKIDSMDMTYKVVNAGVSGETSAGGNARIDWILKQPIDVFVLELGANDGLRGIPVAETKKNLQSIIDKVKGKYPEAKLVLAGMQVPPNMGQKYANDFRNMFPELAKKNNMALIPFILEGVGGVRELNQADAIHPTAAGAKILAKNVWTVLEDVLDK
jgi:acyl-CoA thioesterase-1